MGEKTQGRGCGHIEYYRPRGIKKKVLRDFGPHFTSEVPQGYRGRKGQSLVEKGLRLSFREADGTGQGCRGMEMVINQE